MDHKIGAQSWEHKVASSNGTLYLKHYTSNNLLEEAIENCSTRDCILGHIWLLSLQVSFHYTTIKAILDNLSSDMLHASQPIS